MKQQTLCALLAAATLVSSELAAVPITATVIHAEQNQTVTSEEPPSAASAAEVLEQVKDIAPVLSEDGTSIRLPASSNPQYEVQLYGSSNESVIDLDGNIHLPLEDMKVYIMYRVVNKEDDSDYALDQRAETSLIIPGRYTHEESDNARPKVLPDIQEWKGSAGSLQMADDVRLIISQPDLEPTAEVICSYFTGMLGWAPVISTESPRAGDIVLTLNSDYSVLGKEGYTLETADVVSITAPEAKGILYGGTTLVQILMQNGHSVPKGMIRDYPAYEVRSCMQDVARFYMPLDYLEEVTQYMAFFKLNEFHIHINDNGGEQSHALRVESKKYPELNKGLNPDEVYSQEDYRNYQKRCAKYGIEIVTEIDTPAHAGFVGEYDSSLLLDGYHIDLGNENVLPFIKSLLDEYLDGEDPVFQGTKFNIGTDEYDKTYSEDVRSYMNELIEYVNAKGREVRMWASLGTNGFDGTTPVSDKAVGHYWSASWASYEEMLNMGYPCINNNDGNLYSVPGAGYYHDHIDLKGLYETWEANYLVPSYHIARSNPLMLGSEAACWYDAKTGMSQFDIFDRTREQIALMSEKNWTGDRRDDQTAEEFISRVDKLARRSPLSNPGRNTDSESETVLFYDFENTEGNVVKDSSSNSYDGFLTDTQPAVDQYRSDNHALTLNGEGYLSMPFDTMGFPYSVSFDLYLEKEQEENAVLFQGKDGILFANYEGSGKLAFQRKGYTYLFDIEVPAEVWTTILLTCDHSVTRLYFNGIYAAEAHYYKVTGASKEASSTFVLPLEQVGGGIHGAIDNIRILDHAVSYEEITGLDLIQYSNRALNKPVSVSGLEVYDGRFTAEMANDGDPATRVSLERKDSAWWQVDLEQSVLIDKIVINWSERPHSYQIQISDDGENWTTIFEDLTCVEKSSGEQTYSMTTPLKARYVRYQQLKQFLYENDSYYSGNFREFEVWAYDTSENPILSRASQLLETTEETDTNRSILKRLALAQELYDLYSSSRNMEEMALVLRKMSELCDSLEQGVLWSETDTGELETLIRNREKTNLYSDASTANYLIAYRMGLGSVLDGSLSQAALDNVLTRLKESLASLEIRDFISVSTSRPVYKDNEPSNLLDGKNNTFFWQNGNQKAGDWLEFRFREPQDLHKIAIDNTGCGGDVLVGAVVMISSDGMNWNTAGTLKGDEITSVEFDSVPVLKVRIELTEDAEKWWKMNEVIFNDGLLCDWYWLDREIAQQVSLEGCTVSSIDNWNKALESAKALHHQEGVTQHLINAALEKLQNARAALELIGDLTPVREVIMRYEGISLEGYTAYSRSHLEKALQNARELLEDPSDAGAVTIERTIQSVQTAADHLKELIHGVDTSLLDQTLDEIRTEQGSVSFNSWNSYQHLIEEARKYAADQGTTILDEGILNTSEALNRTLSTLKEKDSSNIALHRPVTCSGLEVDREDVRADKVTDGDLSTRIALHQKHDSWITVDLEEPVLIDRVIFRWAERPRQYKVQVSLDNENWTDVYEDNTCAEHTKGDDYIDFAPVTARYVKYQQIEMQSIGYSGTCYEFEVYNSDTHVYSDELSWQITSAESQDQTDLSEKSKVTLAELLETARTAMHGTDQEAIDQAADALRNLVLEITLENYSTLLREVIEQVQSLAESRDQFTSQSWSACETALIHAQDVLTSARSREEIDEAQNSLISALAGLVKTANRSLLKMAIDYAREAESDGALKGLNELVAAEFREALTEAESILNDDSADQNTVNAAWIRLVRACHMLEFRTDKEELAALVRQAESLNLEEYRDGETKAVFKAALEKAKEVLADPAALTDVSIQSAVESLTTAMAALELKISTSLLEWLISTVESADLSLYVQTGDFSSLLDQARQIVKHPENQQQVDDMIRNLNRSWMNLRRKPDEALLKELQNVYEKLNAVNLLLYTPAVQVQFNAVKAEVRNVLEDPDADQLQVQAVVKKAEALLRIQPEHADSSDPSKTDFSEEMDTDSPADREFHTAAPQSVPDSTRKTTARSLRTAAFQFPAGWMAAAASSLLTLMLIRHRKNRK